MTTPAQTERQPVRPRTSAGEPVIEAARLTKVFGPSHESAPSRRLLASRWGSRSGSRQVVAIDDVSFSVASGELFVIMGLSGSGKSTLLRMLNRLVEPTSGELRMDGRNVAALTDSELRDLRNRKVNMVFQHFALFPHRTVLENAAYGLHVRRVPAAQRLERANWALRTVGLADRADAFPGELSGGMRQRVGLARALATDAEILLMDEPFSALDPLIRREMQDLLLRLQHELRRTIVFVTHDLNEAMRLGDRIMVMRAGRVVQTGTAAEILSAPADDYVADFVSDVDRSRVLTAGAVVREPLVLANEADHPRDVLRLLGNIEAVGAYVVDGDGRLLGVARHDLLARATESDSSLRECLCDEYERATSDTPLSELFSLVDKGIVPLAVIDGNGKLLGVLPRAAMLAALTDPRKVVHA
ncbi:MAG TPA: betaine/proline/choline family ABC transporter ATP-binding protein [Amycolatopsis sp.]|uniref:quaternary amine ABC transporter ATP-binding protein n=1 Tax=Amycolatopsis sp. TaxID=37632 RepID=UPI002B4A9FDC|nr:betaine/proline/choline family ABC transporter ATP-binding protein [Amycolatopsis sp.]HKS47526.1 betaine/proline/choline family ABC transporter ATP-binding protein [Amycolatopsis sp.]